MWSKPCRLASEFAACYSVAPRVRNGYVGSGTDGPASTVVVATESHFRRDRARACPSVDTRPLVVVQS